MLIHFLIHFYHNLSSLGYTTVLSRRLDKYHNSCHLIGKHWFRLNRPTVTCHGAIVLLAHVELAKMSSDVFFLAKYIFIQMDVYMDIYLDDALMNKTIFSRISTCKGNSDNEQHSSLKFTIYDFLRIFSVGENRI